MYVCIEENNVEGNKQYIYTHWSLAHIPYLLERAPMLQRVPPSN